MSIDPINLPGLSLIGGIALPGTVTADARTMFSDLQQLLKADPQALAKDPGMRDLLNQVRNLGNALRGLRKTPLRNQNPQLYKQLRSEAAAKLGQVLKTMKERVDGLLRQSSPSVTEAATSRYGSDISADIDKIMNSSASIEDKLAMLAGLMSDHLDDEIEKLMKQWSSELKKPTEDTGTNTAKSIGLGILGAICPLAVPAVNAIASAIEGASKGEKRDKQKIDQLQTQIQLLNDKKKNFLQMVSNLMASESRTQSAIIANIRG